MKSTKFDRYNIKELTEVRNHCFKTMDKELTNVGGKRMKRVIPKTMVILKRIITLNTHTVKLSFPP